MSAVYKKRFEVVFLVLHPKGPKVSVKSAAKYTKSSVTFVNKWIKRFKENGNVDDLPERGSQRCTTEAQDKMIIKIFEKNPDITLRSAQQKLEKKGLKVSIFTIRRRLLEKDIKCTAVLKKPLLTPEHVEKRLQWAHENKDRDWSKVIFTDESTFCVNNCVRRVWSKKGEKIIQRTIKHPAKVHVYGCLSANGMGKLITFTGNLDAKRMIELYQKGLLESAKRLFGANNNDWELQEDNDPKHRSALCRRWKEQNGIKSMDWPSQSPDANPIKNVWALMKHKLQGLKIGNTDTYKKHCKKFGKILVMTILKI